MTRVTFNFPSEEAAEAFLEWLSESGEQSLWEYLDAQEREYIEFDYREGSGFPRIIKVTVGDD